MIFNTFIKQLAGADDFVCFEVLMLSHMLRMLSHWKMHFRAEFISLIMKIAYFLLPNPI